MHHSTVCNAFEALSNRCSMDSDEFLAKPRARGSAFGVQLTPERLALIQEVEATAPIWRPEDHPV